MLTKNYIESTLKKLKPILVKKYAIKNIGFYGSYVKNLQTNSSDIDILLELNKPLGWDFFTIQNELEDILKVKIDLATKKSLHPDLQSQILKEVVFV